MQRLRIISLILLLGASMAVSVAFAQRAPETPRQGGTLIVAAPFEADTLDASKTTRAITNELTALMVEGLFALDNDGVPQPALVDRYEVDADGLVYTLHLRQGIRFHDGSDFDADDVIASMERWFNYGYGRLANSLIDALVRVDDHTVRLELNEAYPLLLNLMAIPGGTSLFIYPASLIEAVGLDNINEPIGTGPFKFDRWVRGTLFRVVRNDDYQARSEPTNGFAGDQTPWLDAIEHRVVPDAAVRLAGLEAGEFDVAREMPSDFYDLIVSNPALRPQIFSIGPLVVQIDRSHGLTSAGWTGMREFRQAMNYATDKFELAAAAGRPEFYDATDCNFAPVPDAWRTDVCQDLHHAYDPERARQILAEIGYDGTPLTFVTNPAREHFFYTALATAQQLRDVGIEVEIMSVDAATMLEMRAQPRTWDMISGSHSSQADPTLWSPIQPDSFGWFGDYPDHLLELLEATMFETDPAARIALWEQVTLAWYDWLPLLKVADANNMNVENVRFSGAVQGLGLETNYGIGWK